MHIICWAIDLYRAPLADLSNDFSLGALSESAQLDAPVLGRPWIARWPAGRLREQCPGCPAHKEPVAAAGWLPGQVRQPSALILTLFLSVAIFTGRDAVLELYGHRLLNAPLRDSDVIVPGTSDSYSHLPLYGLLATGPK